MSESDAPDEMEWAESLTPDKPKKKRGALFWIGWGCGCGCLGLVVLVLILFYFGAQAVDSEKQWPKLREQIAYDSQPQDLEMELGWDWFGPARYQLIERETNLSGVFMVPTSDEDLELLMTAAAEENPALEAKVEATTLEVQGQSVRALIIHNVFDTSEVPKWFSNWAELPEGEHDLGRTVRVDLSGPGGRRLVFDLMPGADPDEGPTVEDVEPFLESFDVWRQP